MTHTLQQAKDLKSLLKQALGIECVIIGSLGRDKTESNNDIDIHIINRDKVRRFKKLLKDLLEPESIEDTDWGGWYFNKTKEFGNVDIFFDISELKEPYEYK